MSLKESLVNAPLVSQGCFMSLQWRHNERDGVSNHRRHDCLLECLFRCRSKKASKLRVSGLCEGNSPMAGEFPAQRVSNTKNVSIWWRHHVFSCRNSNFSQLAFCDDNFWRIQHTECLSRFKSQSYQKHWLQITAWNGHHGCNIGVTGLWKAKSA